MDIQQKTGVGNFTSFSCILMMSHTPYVAVCGGWDAALLCPSSSVGAGAQGADGSAETPALQRTRIDFS